MQNALREVWLIQIRFVSSFRRASSRSLCTHTSHFLSVLIFRRGTELGKGDLIIHAPRHWGSNRLTCCYLSRKPSDATLRSGGARGQGWSEKKMFRFLLFLSLLFVLSPLEWLLSHCGVSSLSLFRSSTAGKPCCGLFCTTQSSTRPPHPFLFPVVCAERITNARRAPLSSKHCEVWNSRLLLAHLCSLLTPRSIYYVLGIVSDSLPSVMAFQPSLLLK